MNTGFRLITLCIALLFGCASDQVGREIETENVIIIIVDGARRSETWDDPTHSHIPFQFSLRDKGSVYETFRNNGYTRTVPGHTAIMTGYYQDIDNAGLEIPLRHSFFQKWLKESGLSANKAWIISSKDKLEVLANTQETDWSGVYQPKTDCGINGNGTGYRHDSITLAHTLTILQNDQPQLVMINFREPDFSAHSGNWQAYLDGIEYTDSCIGVLYDYINHDPHYKGKTTVFITNDHGRHLDGVADGFASHGDHCSGCKNISLLITGPDCYEGKVINTIREQIDIPVTVAYLMKTKFNSGNGALMIEMLKH